MTHTYKFCNIIRMNTKLTLSIDSAVIDTAKRNLQTKTKTKTKTKRIMSSPVVKELTGIARVNKNIDEKDIISEYLLEKYK